jgi:hypothetical protein
MRVVRHSEGEGGEARREVTGRDSGAGHGSKRSGIVIVFLSISIREFVYVRVSCVCWLPVCHPTLRSGDSCSQGRAVAGALLSRGCCVDVRCSWLLLSRRRQHLPPLIKTKEFGKTKQAISQTRRSSLRDREVPSLALSERCRHRNCFSLCYPRHLLIRARCFSREATVATPLRMLRRHLHRHRHGCQFGWTSETSHSQWATSLLFAD